MNSLDTFVATLRRHGQSATTPRRVVFEALQGQEPLTMHELLVKCVGIDRASVYRTVALFESLGIVQRLQVGWKYRLELSDQFHTHHHHASCLRCGKTVSLPEDRQLEKLLHEMAASKQFMPLAHQLELQGYCKDCAAK